MRSILKISIVLASLSLVMACSDDEPSSGWRVSEGDGDQTEFGDDSAVIVAADGNTFVVTGSGTAGDCVDIDGNCVDLADVQGRYCDEEGAQADVILNEEGDVIEVICYPPADDGTPVEELEVGDDGKIELPQNESGSVIIFPEDTDGTVLEGDLTLEAERTTLFGNGVEETIIGGDLVVESNNSRVRGLTVEGKVRFPSNSNNSALILCKIHGNLEVESNGFSAANCEVYGDVKVSGNGATLVNIGVGGGWMVSDNAVCEGCYSFADENEDFELADEEVGDPVDCGND